MLVSVGEYRQKLNGIVLTEGQRKDVELLLSGLQQELELWLNRPVEPILVSEYVRPEYGGSCRLSVTPVLEVISWSQSKAPGINPEWAPEPFTRPAGYDEEIRKIQLMGGGPYGYTIVPGGISGVGGPGYVTYLGGLPKDHPQISAIKRKILEIAARSSVFEKSDAIGLSDGNPRTADEMAQASGWTEPELRQFERLRRRVAF